MAHTLKNKTEFKITEDLTAFCYCQNTSYGFRHVAQLIENGHKKVANAKAKYYNRAWESFQYETVLKNLLNKYDGLTDEQKNQYLANRQTLEHEKVEKQFSMISTVMKMGEFLTNNKKDTNDWKLRMMKAGFCFIGEDISVPEDWNELTEDEKEIRLNKVIEANK